MKESARFLSQNRSISHTLSSLSHSGNDAPPCLLPWLAYEYSLTGKLQRKAKQIRLQIVRQIGRSPTWWDRYVLSIQNESVLHREILMWGDQSPCWYGRTILPASTYCAAPLFFNRLEKESLGQLIFDEPMVKRIEMRHYAVNSQTLEYYWPMPYLDELELVNEYWLRLSSFVVNGVFPFYLVEILLPGLMRYVD